MSHQAFHRRTFGIENDDWLGLSFAVSFVILVVQVLSFSIEYILLFFKIFKLIPSPANNDDFVNWTTTLHFAGFLATLLAVVLLGVKSDMEWKSHRTAFRIMASFTALTVIYLYNPWIVAYQVEVFGFYDVFKYTTIVFIFSALIFSVACFFSTFILWRMSRIEADYEPCEVIYGAEDSETKKLMEYYE